jgi:adenosylhomocysteine nucleosidase
MPVDGSSSAAAVRIAIIAALSLERRPLSCRPPSAEIEIAVHQSGPGAKRASRAAAAALDAGASALISWGVAAGLEPRLAAGTVVVPRRVVLPDGRSLATDRPWQSALAQALAERFTISEGNLLASDVLLHTPRAKAHAAAATGAVAADMESAAIAEAAAAAAVPFVVLRVIVDTLADSLPPNAERWIDASGNRRLAPAFGVVLRPAQWHVLWMLAQRYRRARHVLHRLARCLTATSFLYAQQRQLLRS